VTYQVPPGHRLCPLDEVQPGEEYRWTPEGDWHPHGAVRGAHFVEARLARRDEWVPVAEALGRRLAVDGRRISAVHLYWADAEAPAPIAFLVVEGGNRYPVRHGEVLVLAEDEA